MMEGKPLNEIRSELESPVRSAEAPDLDGDLNPIDAIRKSLGLPYNPDAKQLQYEDRPLEGELPEDDMEFKAGLLQAAAVLGAPPAVAYYPGCGEHVSLATVFPAARTIFLDESGDVHHRFLQHNVDPLTATMNFTGAICMSLSCRTA